MSLYADMLHDGADPDELGERLANELQAERQRSNKAERQLDACMAQAREVKKGRDELRSIIAACRDAMPDIPGHEDWPQWAEAVSDPGSVPGYVRRCVDEQSARLAAAERARDGWKSDATLYATNSDHWQKKYTEVSDERDAAQARVAELEHNINAKYWDKAVKDNAKLKARVAELASHKAEAARLRGALETIAGGLDMSNCLEDPWEVGVLTREVLSAQAEARAALAGEGEG
jgi:uncharacterized coiled-coil DUF342 family protein